VVVLLLGLLAHLGTQNARDHFEYFLPFTRETFPPVVFAYVFAAEISLKVFLAPFGVVTLGISMLLLL
jgi:hypothetical protein